MASRSSHSGQVRALRSRLDHFRAAAFTGRREELQLFEALLALDSPFHVLLLHGPAGVGKSTLLEAFGRRTRELGMPIIEIQAPNLPSGPERAQQALQAQVEALRAEGGLLLLVLQLHL